MKLLKSLHIAVVAFLWTAAVVHSQDRSYGQLLVAAPSGATRLVAPEHLFGTNYNQDGVLATNIVAVHNGSGWAVFEVMATEILDEMSQTSHLVYVAPYWDYRPAWRFTFASTTEGHFTNAQAGLTLIRIPPGKAALVGNGYLADFQDYSLAALFGGQDMHPRLDSWTTNASGLTFWNLACGSNWVGRLPNQTVIAGISSTNSWPLDWVGKTWHVRAPDQSAGWSPGDDPWPIGNGRLVFNPDANTEMVFTMRGTCVAATTTNTIPAGWSCICPINGDSGELLGLNFPYDANTVIKRWDSTNSQWITYCATNSVQPGMNPGMWDTNQPGYEPAIEPGEAFVCYQSQAKDWVLAGASSVFFTTKNVSTNFLVEVLSQTSSNLTLALLNSTSNAVYIVESRTNVASGSWTSVLTNTSTNATSHPLPPISRSGDALFFRARAQ